MTPSLLPPDWRRDPVAAGILLASATAQLPPPRPPRPERKELPPFWPGVPPQPGPGLYQRFLPGSDATWVPAAPVSAGAAANSAVFACLNVICTAFPEPPLRVFRRQTEGEPKALPDHPLQGLLERPNPYHSVSELWYWVQFAKHVHGNAYLEKVRAGDPAGGNVVELWPLSPTRVQPITTPEDRRAGVFISWYEYETEPGKRRRLRPEDVLHFRLGLEDADHRLGCSPLRRLLQEVASDDETTRFMLALLANFAVPGLIVTTPDRTLSQEDADRLKQNIATRFSGDSRGTVGVLNNGATAAQFGFSPEQLDLKALHRVPEERISAVMGVPAIVAGLGAGLDRSTYSNVREAREMFTETKLVPLWNDDAGTVNLQLLPDFDRNRRTFCRFDLTDVRALQEDEDKKYARLDLGVQHKWITVNEARQDVGLPPVEGGDELTPPAPQLVPGSAQGAPAPRPGALPDGQAGQRRLPPPAERALADLETKAVAVPALPAMLDAVTAMAQPGLRRALEAYFAAQHRRVVDAVLQEG